jgi:hypothetical protein
LAAPIAVIPVSLSAERVGSMIVGP